MSYAYSWFGFADDTEREQIARRARSLAARAIKDGVLVRGHCEYEKPWRSCLGVIQAHHDDYEKPLEVRWLCHFHHANLHQEWRTRNAKAQFNDDSFLYAVERLVRDEKLTDEEIAERLAFAIDRARNHRGFA